MLVAAKAAAVVFVAAILQASVFSSVSILHGTPDVLLVVLIDTLFQRIALNLILTWPVYALFRRLLPALTRPERVRGVELLG